MWLVSSVLLKKGGSRDERHLRHLLPLDILECCYCVGITKAKIVVSLLFLCHVLFATAVLNGAI